MSEEHPLGLEPRPRFGVLRLHTGQSRTVVFYPHENLPNTFVCHYADTEEVAVVDAKAGDRIMVDNLPPGMSIYIEYPDKPGPVRGQLQSDRNKNMTENDNKTPRPRAPWWQGLIMLAGLAAIVVLTIKGISWALS